MPGIILSTVIERSNCRNIISTRIALSIFLISLSLSLLVPSDLPSFRPGSPGHSLLLSLSFQVTSVRMFHRAGGSKDPHPVPSAKYPLPGYSCFTLLRSKHRAAPDSTEQWRT